MSMMDLGHFASGVTQSEHVCGGGAVSKRVRTEHTYDVSAERLWSCCVSYASLAQTMSSLVAYEGLPDGEMQAGDDLSLEVVHFKFTKAMNWHVVVLERDDNRHVLKTSESGGLVRSYFHTLSVENLGDGKARLIDDVSYDAGWLSIPIGWWIRHIYKTRDAPRRLILGL